MKRIVIDGKPDSIDSQMANILLYAAGVEVSPEKLPMQGVALGRLVSWPGEWSLVGGEIRVQATIPTNNPPQTILVKIDLNELKNRIFRAQLRALLAS